MQVIQADAEFSKKNRLNGNLKSMTSKQFVEIVDYFGQRIAGKSILTSKDPISDIWDFLKALDYPYTITKSALKTPNTMHAFPDCIGLLAWLSDFVTEALPPGDILKLISDNAIECDNRFPSVEYSRYFFNEILTGFKLWNSGRDEEFEAQKGQLKNEYIAAATRENISSVDAIVKATTKYSNAVEKMQRNPCIVKNEKEFETQREQAEKIAHEEETIRALCDKHSDELASLKVKLADSEQIASKCEAEVNATTKTIATQRYTAAQYSELQAQIKHLSASMKTTQAEIDALKNNSCSMQLELARSLNKKNEAIVQLNMEIMRISQMMSQTSLINDFDVNVLHIEPNAMQNDLQRLNRKLNVIKQKVEQCIDDYEQKFNDFKLNRQKLDIRLKSNDREQKLLEALQRDMIQKINKYSLEIAEVKQKYHTDSNVMALDITKLKDVCSDLTTQLEETKLQCAVWDKQIKLMMEACSEKAAEILEIKQNTIDQLFEKLVK